MILFFLALVVVIATSLTAGFFLTSKRIDETSAMDNLDLRSVAKNKSMAGSGTSTHGIAPTTSRENYEAMRDAVFQGKTRMSDLTVEELRVLTAGHFNPTAPLSKEQTVAKIAELEAVLLDFEDRYASVQADAEVTSDWVEIRALDESYGNTEEAIQNHRDQLDAIIEADTVGMNEMERLMDDLF